MMEILSVNVSPPIEVEHDNATVRTGIFKQPVNGPVAVSALNLEGDGQADLKVHGGVNKAVYAYSYDHYPYWQELLKRDDFSYGQFGENLTVAGLDETESCIGDELQAGTALFTISQPRVPCFKLGIRFDDPEMPKHFVRVARTGFYLKVLREGVIQAGDVLELTRRGHGEIAVRTLFEALYNRGVENRDAIFKKALEIPELSPEWIKNLARRI